MKKLLFVCLCIFGLLNSSFADKYCNVECNSSLEGKIIICPETDDNLHPKFRICESNKWEAHSGESAYWCTDYKKANGWKDLGPWSTNTYLFLSNTIRKTGNGYIVSGQKNSEDKITPTVTEACVGCRQGFHYDTNSNECVMTTDVSHLGKPCSGKAQNDRCYSLPQNATLGRCRNLSAENDETNYMICAAVKCESNYYLWLDNQGNSQGGCHSLKKINKACKNKCSNCGEGKKCVAKIVDIPASITINGYTLTAADRKNGAYQEGSCQCVDSSAADDEGDDDETDVSAEVSAAQSRLDTFFGSAKVDKWKNEEGKFNAIRLASDLTAGVVLGTVGGVISGVVIKKKQIEKGFEVLQCTVGGQKVADWGDEFRVGFHR